MEDFLNFVRKTPLCIKLWGSGT